MIKIISYSKITYCTLEKFNNIKDENDFEWGKLTGISISPSVSISNMNESYVNLNNVELLDIFSIQIVDCKIDNLQINSKARLHINKSIIETIKSENLSDVFVTGSSIDNMHLTHVEHVKLTNSVINSAIFDNVSTICREIPSKEFLVHARYLKIKMCGNIRLSNSEKLNIKFLQVKNLDISGDMNMLSAESLSEINRLMNENEVVQVNKNELAELLIEHRSMSTKSANF